MKKKVEIATQIAKSIQDEFGTRITKHDELTNKYVLIEKELANVKKSIKGKININKKMIISLKKKRDNIRKKLNAENEKNWLDLIKIEEEKRVQSQYLRVEEEKSARKATKYDTKDYKKKGWIFKGAVCGGAIWTRDSRGRAVAIERPALWDKRGANMSVKGVKTILIVLRSKLTPK